MKHNWELSGIYVAVEKYAKLAHRARSVDNACFADDHDAFGLCDTCAELIAVIHDDMDFMAHELPDWDPALPEGRDSAPGATPEGLAEVEDLLSCLKPEEK